GYGARVRVTAGGRTQTAWARAAHSYASQSEDVLTFGLGGAAGAEVTVEWPSGKVSRLESVAPGGVRTVREADAG
ncbi:MAG: CRTAC1 family protein, partial [Gemmatimonadetes bacterium]|nr:CRTAC1 family protein [Gemmatimonadota bacterium]